MDAYRPSTLTVTPARLVVPVTGTQTYAGSPADHPDLAAGDADPVFTYSTVPAGLTLTGAYCGDGIKQAEEACDDGDLAGGPCNNTCSGST